jgi:hypothetical protein
MGNFLRTVQFLTLGLWLGSDVFLSFVVAPGAFGVLAARDQAGAMVGFALTRLHIGGLICGVIFLLARFLYMQTFTAVSSAPALWVWLMILATAISQLAVSPKMAALRVQMGSVQATAADSPLLAEFSKLHRVSVSLESVVLLGGLTATFFLVRELASGK